MNKPDSPAVLAKIASNGRWILAPHLELLNRALVYLTNREAPASFLKQLANGLDTDYRDKLLAYLEPYEDDEPVPFRRLIIEMPPRHGKSEMVSRYFPAWYIGTRPDDRVILCSYEANFARSWGRKARDVLRDFGPELFNVKVKHDTLAANDWEIEGSDGGMITSGVGGPITGRGANLLVVDDAVKNAEEAASPAIQKSNADWWDSTAYTRLEPDAVVCVMGTRWNEKDLTGHILSLGDDDEIGELEDEIWYVLKLPATAVSNDSLGRQPGEPLWPSRYPLERLQRIAQRIGSYFYGALYQQRPSNEEGNIFKRGWWNFYDTLPPEAANAIVGYVIVDTAGYDDKTTGDYAAISVVAKAGKDLYWRRALRGHWEFPELKQRIKDQSAEFKLPILIEETPWAKPLIQSLEQEVGGVVPFKIEGKSKLTRAQAASPYAEAGNFYLPRRAPWVRDFIEEHAAFPNGANDDWVDTTSMAVLKMILNAGGFQYSPPQAYDLQHRQPEDTRGSALGVRQRVAPIKKFGGGFRDKR